MPVPSDDCTSAILIPDLSAHIQEQFDLLMDAARNVCDDFEGELRADGGWRFVPACRVGATTRRNLLTVWPNSQSLRIDIRPHPNQVNGPQTFLPGELHFYQQRMAALYQTMQQL